jgi:hypothetical protein
MLAEKFIGIFVFLVGLAALAVIVSKRSNTAAVLSTFLKGFSDNLRAAVSPVTGR